jgi:hypothetical protein
MEERQGSAIRSSRLEYGEKKNMVRLSIEVGVTLEFTNVLIIDNVAVKTSLEIDTPFLFCFIQSLLRFNISIRHTILAS